MEPLSAQLDSAEERRAQALLAKHVVDHLEATMPRGRGTEWDGTPSFRPEGVPQLPAVLRDANPEDVQGNELLRDQLSRHTALVTSAEARNAARLRTLCWAYHELAGTAEADKLLRWTKERYRIGGSLPSDAAGRRRFSVRATRRYDALPKEWREI